MKKILTVIGTRPEAIKLCPLVLELKSRPDQFESIVCLTGQHREMLDQVMETFGIKAEFDLNIMSPGQSLAQVTARATTGLDEVIGQAKPDVVIVQGDTTTAFCGALAGFYHQVPVAHVEAGLRTGNKKAPFPEEANRCLIGQLAEWHFPPTQMSQQALLNEGVPSERAIVTGNTVIDALLWIRDRVEQNTPALPEGLEAWLDGKLVVLVTGHRRESFGGGFENLCSAIREVADAHDNVGFVYPMHLNPNVREPVSRILGEHERIKLIEPLSYEPFVWLMNRSTIVLTDSGGVQEEAPSLGKPVLVMRETTERPEGVEAGNAKLVGVDKQLIMSELNTLLSDEAARQAMADIRNPYGDGTASKQICDVLAGLE